MYRRFLNNTDYLSIITEEALTQIIRGSEDRFAQAEEAAEFSVLEYLTENYQIEEELEKGKKIVPYNKQILYPSGVHFYVDGFIYETIRTVSGQIRPTVSPYWEETEVYDLMEAESIEPYSQMGTYFEGDKVRFCDRFYLCLQPNGIKFRDVRIPAQQGWKLVDYMNWEANIEYPINQVVNFNGSFFALCPEDGSLDDEDWSLNPMESDSWQMIADYDPNYDLYRNEDTEFVVYDGEVFVPCMNVNPSPLEESRNIVRNDPRNSNLKKHILRLSLYELHKLISPNNISSIRITDYETSIQWLKDASRLKINPQIPRKIDDKKLPATDYAISTFARDYNPYDNEWHI